MTNANSPRGLSLAGRGIYEEEVLSRDSPPTPRLTPTSTAHEDVPRDLPASLVAEYRAVLSELDWLVAALGVPPTAESPRPAPSRPAPATVPTPRLRTRPEPEIAHEERWGVPSPYLDERLAAARAVAATLANEFGRMERRQKGLRSSVANLEAELARATEELTFLRTNGGFDGPDEEEDDDGEVATARGRSAPSIGPGAPSASRTTGISPSGANESPAYAAFTAARYDETVRDTQSRHGWVAGLTVALAIGISAVLLTITFYAHEAMPVWWLACLPVIWMIPVPFFLASFRGTHRLLGGQPLDLTEAA
jgi:hypothetical protein